MLPTNSQIEEFLIEECNNDDTMVFDHNKKLFLWYDTEYKNWGGTYYSVSETGRIDYEAFPSFRFEKRQNSSSKALLKAATAAGA